MESPFVERWVRRKQRDDIDNFSLPGQKSSHSGCAVRTLQIANPVFAATGRRVRRLPMRVV